VLLLGYCVVMSLAAAPVVRYAAAAAEQVLSPGDYVQAVRGTVPQLRQP